MKKLTAAVAAIALLFSLAACDAGGEMSAEKYAEKISELQDGINELNKGAATLDVDDEAALSDYAKQGKELYQQFVGIGAPEAYAEAQKLFDEGGEMMVKYFEQLPEIDSNDEEAYAEFISLFAQGTGLIAQGIALVEEGPDAKPEETTPDTDEAQDSKEPAEDEAEEPAEETTEPENSQTEDADNQGEEEIENPEETEQTPEDAESTPEEGEVDNAANGNWQKYAMNNCNVLGGERV